jgi:hypothetical protein
VTLDVMHGNPARFLYLRLGFRQRSQNAATRQMIWRPPRGRSVAPRLSRSETLNGCGRSHRLH